MKAIMISIKPKWCAEIMNGNKTIEIRKTMPKCDLPIDVYIYCTKDKYEMGKFNSDKKYHEIRDDCCYAGGWLRGLPDEIVNGKVVAKFTLNKVEEIKVEKALCVPKYTSNSMNETELCKKSSLSIYDLNDYLQSKNGYAIHISDLEIFDKPKWLIDFKTKVYPNKKDSLITKSLTKAPQNYCYVEVE